MLPITVRSREWKMEVEVEHRAPRQTEEAGGGVGGGGGSHSVFTPRSAHQSSPLSRHNRMVTDLLSVQRLPEPLRC